MKTASDIEVQKEIQLIANKKKRGVVIGNKLSDGDQVIVVEWADGTLAKVNINDVQICLSMEEEFELVKNQVNDKLAVAAAAIRDAAALARNAGHTLLEAEYGGATSQFEIDQIESAMDDAGWATSSWYC